MKANLLTVLAATFLLVSSVWTQTNPEEELILDKGVAPHAKIDDVYRRFSEGYKKFDAEAIANLYTEDAFYLSPGNDVKRGREKVMAEFSGYFNSVKNTGGSLTVSFQILDRNVSGDLAYDVGIYTAKEKSAKGETRTGRGKFVVIARRQKSGEWRFHIDSFNELPNARTQN